jgi:hypothetical protein
VKFFRLDSSARTSWYTVIIAWTMLCGLVPFVLGMLAETQGPSASTSTPTSTWFNGLVLSSGFIGGAYLGVLHAIARQYSSGLTVSARLMAWSAMTGLNLTLPLLIALPVLLIRTDEATWTGGMAAALVLLYAIGCLLCVLTPRLSRRLIAGCGLLAFSQFCPIAQFCLYAWSLKMATTAGLVVARIDEHGVDVTQVDSAIGAFFVTALMGSVLLMGAIVAGCVLVEPESSGEQLAAMVPA